MAYLDKSGSYGQNICTSKGYTRPATGGNWLRICTDCKQVITGQKCTCKEDSKYGDNQTK